MSFTTGILTYIKLYEEVPGRCSEQFIILHIYRFKSRYIPYCCKTYITSDGDCIILSPHRLCNYSWLCFLLIKQCTCNIEFSVSCLLMKLFIWSLIPDWVQIKKKSKLWYPWFPDLLYVSRILFKFCLGHWEHRVKGWPKL